MTGIIAKIENVNGELVVSSRVIAEQLGKEHRGVLRDLDNMLEGMPKSVHTQENLIISSTYVNEQNKQTYREYLLTKKGFTLYVMNIQGYNEFKLAYIEEFDRMKNALNNPLSMLLSMNKESLALTCIQLTQVRMMNHTQRNTARVGNVIEVLNYINNKKVEVK